jgi:hypothetical protein
MATSLISDDKPIIKMPPPAHQKNHRMRPSLETAVHWFDAAGRLLVAALAIGMICTIIIVLMGIVKEGYWDEAREAAKLQIAELGAAAEKAKADVKKAHVEIAR